MKHMDASKRVEQPPKKKTAWEREQEVLETLRSSVLEAIEEIGRLRAENAVLTERLGQMSGAPQQPSGGTLLDFNDPPEALKEKVQGFIDAIDTYLETYTDAAPISASGLP